MDVSRNSEVKKSHLRTKIFNNKPSDNILWIFLLDLLMKPQFEQYIRWTGKDLEFIIINGFVVFTEFQQRKWFSAEPTPLGEDPGVRWSNCLVDKTFVKERMRGLSLEYYNHKDEKERPDKPWIKKIERMVGGYSFTTSKIICNKLQMPIEQLLKYSRYVGSKYDYPKIGSIRNNKTKKSKKGSTEKTENKKINGKKSTSAFTSNVKLTKQVSFQSDNLLLEQQYVGSHPSPPNFGIGTPPVSPEGQLSQDKHLLSEHHSPQNWNIEDISQDNVNLEPRERFSQQHLISSTHSNYAPQQAQSAAEFECPTWKKKNLQEAGKLSGNILKRKVGIPYDMDQPRAVDCHTEPLRKKIKETPYRTICKIPEPQFRSPFIYSNTDHCPVSNYVEQCVLPGWNYDITDEQDDFYDSQLNPNYGPVSSFHYDAHLLQPFSQNNSNLVIGVVHPHHHYNSVLNQSSNQTITNEPSTHATGVLCVLSPSDILPFDSLNLEQCSHTELPSPSNIDLNLQCIEDWDVVSVEELYQYLFD